jgi:dTDP-4-dehydrorhamnose reductase
MGAVKNKASKIFITGANGLLGQKVVKLCQKKDIDFLATSSGSNRNPELAAKNYQKIDITDKEKLLQSLDSYKPNCIINTAAMTNVDLCKSLIEECYEINTHSVKSMLDWSSKNEAHLIQISTDFIFDGKKDEYFEVDQPNPISVYGDAKNKAEDYLLSSNYKNWSVLRTSVVYGVAHNLKRSNIVLWARSELLRNRTVKIVDDQFRAPTWADDLAFATLASFENKGFGVFNTVGSECMSMHAFVSRMAKYYKQPQELVIKIKSDELQQVANRPLKTCLNTNKAKNEFNYSPISIEESLMILEKELPNYKE